MAKMAFAKTQKRWKLVIKKVGFKIGLKRPSLKNNHQFSNIAFLALQAEHHNLMVR